GISALIIGLTITLITIIIKNVSDAFTGIGWELSKWQIVYQTIKILGGRIANSTNFSVGGNIEGLGQIFITIFALGLIWSSTGIIAAVLTRPRLG
ncbi:MAG: hypothetical protein ACRC63_00920, partial [Metamycoplasmataceae bacterium]